MRSGGDFSSEFVKSFLNYGFATLDTPPAAKHQINGIFRIGSCFFEMDSERKALAALPLDTGYRPFGIEYSAAPTRPDQMESFSVSNRIPIREHILPAIAHDLREEMLKIFDVLEPLVEDLTSSLAKRLISRSTAQRNFQGSFRNWSLLQLNYSHPSIISSDYINDIHEDGCLMTIMSVTGPGLELKASDGSFVPKEPLEQLLFISGEILTLLSGGKVPTVYHRVRPAPGLQHRMSLLR
jgi:isopenicillin N synthase-like dioxygenase